MANLDPLKPLIMQKSGTARRIPKELKEVINSTIQLEECVDEFGEVIVTSEDETIIYIRERDEYNALTADRFRVYNNSGRIAMHPSLEGKKMKVSYDGIGFFMISSERIYHTKDGVNFETLSNILDIAEHGLDEIRTATNNANTATTNANNATGQLNTALGTVADLKSSEDERKANEIIRKNNETNRINEENIRKTNETDRITKENERVTNENSRKTNEDTRILNETGRVNAETQRVTEFTGMKNTIDQFSVCEPYDNAKTYKKYNRVVYQGSSYECKVDTSVGVLPTNTTNWILIALKGTDGLGGDMFKNVYDTNDNGIVDNAEKVNNHTVESDVPSGVVWSDIGKIGSKPVDITGLADGNGLKYDNTNQKWIPSTDLQDLKTQLEDTTLNTFTTNNVITPLTGCIGGFVNINSIQGKTMYKKSDGTITDVWEAGVSLESVGEPIGIGSNLSTPFVSTGIADLKVFAFSCKPNTDYIFKFSKLNIYYSVYKTDGITAIVPYVNANISKNNYFVFNSNNLTSLNIYCKTLDGTSNFPVGYESVELKECQYKIEILSKTQEYIDLDSSKYEVGSIATDGQENNSINTRIRTKKDKMFSIVPNTQYFYKMANGFNISFAFYDNNKNFISTTNWLTDGNFKISNASFFRAIIRYIDDRVMNVQDSSLCGAKVQLSSTFVDATYKQDKTEILTTQPLRKINDTVYDSIDTNGVLTRNCGQVILNGSESWSVDPKISANTINFYLPTGSGYANVPKTTVASKSDKLVSISQEMGYNNNIEGIWQNDSNNTLYITINKSKLATQDVAGFKIWLASNNVTVVYQLATPTTENSNKTLNLTAYKDGSLIVNSGLVNPTVTGTYSTNLGERITSIETSLDGAWNTLLILADKELAMKNISLLTTETTTDLKNKINEILNIWK